MNLNFFSPCDKSITSQPIFRANPNHLPCAKCGSTSRQLGAGRQPNEQSLLCECGKFVKWLRGSELNAIAKIASQLRGGQQ
jgi:hypothetical protein